MINILYTVNNYNIHVFTVNRIKTLIGYYMQAIETIHTRIVLTQNTLIFPGYKGTSIMNAPRNHYFYFDQNFIILKYLEYKCVLSERQHLKLIFQDLYENFILNIKTFT